MTQQQNILNIFQKYSQRLYRFIRQRVTNDQDAEDILQDVWFRLISIIDTQPIEQISAWLYRVSRNRIIDGQRKQKQPSLDDFNLEDDSGDILIAETVFEDLTGPEAEFDQLIFRESFLQALSELPEKQREVFVWNEMEGMTLQEIADKTAENIKTIISRKRYAVKHLKKRLQKFETE